MKDIYEQMAEKWPSAIVSRREVGKFSGGLLNSRTLANLSSRREGPPQIKMGNQRVFYPVQDLVAWLRARVQGQP